LTICDGIIAMEGEGPGSSGTLRPMGLIATSPDALALDCVLAFIMGVEPVSIPTIKEAHRRGLVPGGISKPVIVGDPLNAFAAKNFILPKGSILCKLPRWSLFIVKIVLRMKPAIVPERCVPCGVCGQACPAHAISQKAGRAAIDYKKCILCLCCQEICPHQAVVIKKNIFLRMLSRQ
jgi:Pyruvate/2-oxoacid:ferredoxin oxidoreductase delta subunit